MKYSSDYKHGKLKDKLLHLEQFMKTFGNIQNKETYNIAAMNEI